MDLKKVNCEVGGLVNDNIRKLESIFPSVVKDGEVDFEELKELLGDFKEVDKEKYEMNWVGKKEAKKIALAPLSGKTLNYIKGDGKNEESTENLYIEGDNLEVLKLLQNSYYGKVKMIYIDPPYNTGKDFVYNDDYKENKNSVEIKEGNVNEYGERLIKNQKGAGYFHSKWLSMMYSRILVCKNLLREDGIIFISIDDNELANLKKLCNEIFGEENFISQINIVTGANQSGEGVKIQKNVEYCLVYAKTLELCKINKIDKTEESLRNLNDAPTPLETREDMGYSIYFNKDTKDIIPLKDYDKENIHLNSISKVYKDDINLISRGYIPIRPGMRNNKLHRWRWGIDTFIERKDEIIIKENLGNYSVYFKQDGYNSPKNYQHFSGGTQELKNIFDDKKIFQYPKGTSFIKYLINISTEKDSIILDFFSGSSTTAEANIKTNAEDNGKRKFIMVQLEEDLDSRLSNVDSETKKIINESINFLDGINKPRLISELGKERIRRAGEKILAENKDKEGIENLDIGFKVFRVENSNIRWQNQLEDYGQIRYELDGKNIDDIDFVPGTKDIDVVYEILLRHYGIPLTAKIEKLDFIGNRTYAIEDSIIVCLETQITKDIVDKISELEPVKVIFRDSAFGDDISLKQNSVHRLNLLIEKKNKNTTHVVEFI